jgi:hypothetical protein
LHPNGQTQFSETICGRSRQRTTVSGVCFRLPLQRKTVYETVVGRPASQKPFLKRLLAAPSSQKAVSGCPHPAKNRFWNVLSVSPIQQKNASETVFGCLL